MTQGKPMKLIFDFAMPMMIGSLFQQLYNTVDAVIMGKYEGPDALASIAAAFPLMFFMMSAITGMTMGVSVIISQLYGAGDQEQLKKAVSTSMIFLVGMSVVITAVGLVIIIKELTFDKEMFRHIVSFSVPTAIQQSIVSLEMMSVQGTLNGPKRACGEP